MFRHSLILRSVATLFQLQKLHRVECYGKVIMDGKCMRIWKEEVLACLKLLSRLPPISCSFLVGELVNGFQTISGRHTTSYLKGVRCSLRVKRPEHVTDHSRLYCVVKLYFLGTGPTFICF